jgi:hypothetical protein
VFLVTPAGKHPLPRTSPFSVVLTSDERQELEIRSGQYTSPYYQVIRARMILLAAEGLANMEIGSRLGVPRQVVSKWRKRFVEERLAGLADRPRRGRPRQDPIGIEEASTK